MASFLIVIKTIVVLLIVILLANISLKLINRNLQMKGRVIKIVEKTPISSNSSLALVKILDSYYAMSFNEKENTIIKELAKKDVEEMLIKEEAESKFTSVKEMYNSYMKKRGNMNKRSLLLLLLILLISGIPEPSYAIGGITGLQFGNEATTGATVDTVRLLIFLTVLSLAPSFLILTTSFTRVIIVLSFLRSALGTQQTPPNVLLIGIALFLTLFIMQPVYTVIIDEAWTPFVAEEIQQEEAFEIAGDELKEFMLEQTREKDLALFLRASNTENVEDPMDLGLTTVIPAFALSELKTAFSIGVLIFIPFLVIDMVVSSILMSMGMFMLPPVMISLPFKILLFVLVDGWYLVVESLIASFV